MHYLNKKVALTGIRGFLGAHLAAALENAGAVVVSLDGDVRDHRTFAQLDHTFDYLFHFAAPSSQVQFKRMPSYCIQTTMTGYMNAATAAKRSGIRFVYPSTGLLSSGRYNEYALCKKLCEDYVIGKNMDAIGLRVFATYGPGEDHKRDYASPPFLFARDIVNGRQPVIFGDGKQVRDFIYIEDVVQAILHLAEECSDPVIDIGSGLQTSFNEIVAMLNDCADDDIKPVYIEKPAGYFQETVANPARMLEFYQPKVSLLQGLGHLVEHLQKVKAATTEAAK